MHEANQHTVMDEYALYTQTSKVTTQGAIPQAPCAIWRSFSQLF